MLEGNGRRLFFVQNLEAPGRRSCLILTANASVGVHSPHGEVVFVAWPHGEAGADFKVSGAWECEELAEL